MKVSGIARRPPELDAPHPQFQVRHILQISRVVSDLGRAAAFYRDALGFRIIAQGPLNQATMPDSGVGDAEEVVMRLGAQDVALVRYTAHGRPYPPASRADDMWFQHLAIAVNDMEAAYAHLSLHPGWRSISKGGPQMLPPSNGSVRAFKFRDLDGHPLELIWFPPCQGRPVWHQGMSATPFLGVDHSALSIASTARGVGFYRALGFRVSDRSLNRGPAQARLDGLPGATVRITALRPESESGPGLELLCYHPSGRPAGLTRPNDIVTDWLTLTVNPSSSDLPRAVRDPDGHRLVLAHQGVGANGVPA